MGEWERDEAAIRRRSLRSGRPHIFTDRHDGLDDEIVRAYRSRTLMDEEFRRLKDTPYLSDTPRYH